MFTTAFVLVMVAASAAGAGWVGYFRWKDQARPEPWWLLAATCGGGAFAVLLAALGYEGLERQGHDVIWAHLQEDWPKAVGAALAIGLVEELAKAVPVLAVALLCRHFDEWLDGAVYAGCSGVGFALAETGLHGWAGFTVAELWPRILAAPVTHALFAAPLGLGIAAAVVGRRYRFLLPGLWGSVAAHAAYDLALGRPGVPAVLSALVVAVLWVGFMVLVPRLAKLAPDG